MTRPHPWSDGYVAAVAWQIIWNYGSIWDRVEAVAPDLALDRWRALMGAIRAAGNPVGDQTPAQLPAGAAVAEEIDELYTQIERFRALGLQLFADPAQIPDFLFCTCAFPRLYLGLPDMDMAPPDEVELIHLGDLPPSVPDWLRRGELVRYPRLQVLTLFNCGLGRQPLGIALGKLPVLQALDLRENGLTQLPDEVLACHALTYLNLGDNPLANLPDLTPLTNLRYLGLAQTRLTPAQVARLQDQLPGCTIRR